MSVEIQSLGKNSAQQGATVTAVLRLMLTERLTCDELQETVAGSTGMTSVVAGDTAKTNTVMQVPPRHGASSGLRLSQPCSTPGLTSIALCPHVAFIYPF